MNQISDRDALFVAGGYGVVGGQFSALVRQLYPQIPLILGGRNPEKGRSLADQLGQADVRELDLTREEPLGELRPKAVISLVNDPHNHLLNQAVSLGIPYLDITRWTAALVEVTRSDLKGRTKAPLLFSSGWMAGIASVLAVGLSRELNRVDSLEMDILYSAQDKAGPNSAEYMDRLDKPFLVMKDHRETWVRPLADPKKVSFLPGKTHKVYRFDTPDQWLLPQSQKAGTVSARIGFDDPWVMGMLAGFSRLGIWKFLSHPRFASLRRGILYQPGQGGSHRIRLEAQGMDSLGKSKTLRCRIHDPQGQTHLTAVGTLIQLERLMGWDGAPAPEPGFHYPDSAPQITWALDRLKLLGIEVDFS